MYALSDDVVLIACGFAGLRAFSLNSKKFSTPTVIMQVKNVFGVAYDLRTDTLLLLMPAVASGSLTHYVYLLVSLHRKGTEWRQVQSLETNVSVSLSIKGALDIAVCESHVLLGNGGKTLYVLDVNAEHQLSDAGSATLGETFYALACTQRDGNTYVAFAQETSVSLQRLASSPPRLEPLQRWSNGLIAPRRLLFRGDQLFVADWHKETNLHAILLLRTSGVMSIAIKPQTDISVGAWALAGDRLVLWHRDINDVNSANSLYVCVFE